MESQSSQFKILYVITQGHWGGAQRYVYELATNLGSQAEVHVAIGSDTPNDLAKELKKCPKVTVHILKHLGRSIRPLKDKKAALELKQLINTLSPDVVHGNSTKVSMLLAMIRSKSTAKHIYTAHGWVFHEPMSSLRRAVYTKAEKWAASKHDVVITISKYDEKAAKDILHIPADKVTRHHLTNAPVHYVSKDEAFKKLLSIDKTIVRNKKTAGVIANFYPTKGLDFLIEAIAQEKALQDLQWIIFGDGEQRAYLESLIAKYNLTSIHLLGFVEHAASYLKACDFGVITSRKEGMPYALLEMIGANITVVATDVGGIHEYLPKKYLAQPNTESIKTTLLSSIKQKKQDTISLPSFTEYVANYKGLLKTLLS